MKYSCLFLAAILLFTACKKNIDHSLNNQIPLSSKTSLSSMTPLFVQGDTTGYSTGNITAYQFQTQEINLVAGPNNTYTANFRGVTLEFSNIAHSLYWITAQSARLFTVKQISNNMGVLSSNAPNFSLSGYVKTSPRFSKQT